MESGALRIAQILPSLLLQNILLGRHGRAKLADVGLARLMDEQEPSKASVGTLAWAGGRPMVETWEAARGN